MPRLAFFLELGGNLAGNDRGLSRCIYRDREDLTAPTGYNGVIERQLMADKLPELAKDPQVIIDALWRLGPLAIDSIPESTAAILNQVETGQNETREGIRSIKSMLERGTDSPLGEALIQGPIEHANADQLVNDAEEIAEANPDNAVALLLKASGRLREHGLDVVAESVEQRAAEVLLEHNPERSEEALDLLINAARDQLNRGSSLAQISFGLIENANIEKPEWLAHWINGMQIWPLDPAQASNELLSVIRNDDSPLWAKADAAEVLLLIGGVSEGRHQLSRDADETEDGIRIKLCLADVEHGDWDELADIAKRTSSEMAALIHARHGRYLAHKDRSVESVEAFEKSMTKWSHVPNADEQIASAFYSVQVASQHSHELTDRLRFDLWPLAYELRSPVNFPEARGEALETQGMSNRLLGKYRESLIRFASALLVFRKSGSLNSEWVIHQRLGELNESVNEFDDAIRHYINGGQGEDAKKIVRKCDLEKLEGDIDLTGPAWERLAIYSVLSEIGEVVSPAYVERNLEQIITDTDSSSPPISGLSTIAAVALSTVSPLVPEKDRERVLALVTDQVTDHLGQNEQAAARALELGTEMDLWDESERLLGVFLEEPNVGAVDAGWIADVANREESIAAKLQEAALAGSKRALVALALADIKLDTPRHLISDEMVALCDNHVRSSLGLSSVEVKDGNVAVSGIRLRNVGSIALQASPEVQQELVDDTLRIVSSSKETENFRASAMSTLDDLVPTLSEEKMAEVAEIVSRFAAGNYGLLGVDRNLDHPFSAIRISLHIEGGLQACALQCAGTLEKRTPGTVPDLKDLVLVGLSDPRISVIRGALIAAHDVPSTEYVGLLRYLARFDNAPVRSLAFKAIDACGIAVEAFARVLMEDPAPLVRAGVLDVMLERSEPWASEIVKEMEDDPDPYIRWKARQAK